MQEPAGVILTTVVGMKVPSTDSVHKNAKAL